MKIRKYKKSDESQVKELITNCLIEIFGKPPIDKFEKFEDYLIFYAVEDKNKVIGCAGFEDDGKQIGILNRLYINKNYRKKGLGTKLLRKIEKFAIKNKFNILRLSTYNKMKDAVQFYLKRGFKIYHKEINQWGSKRLLMEKKLCFKY